MVRDLDLVEPNAANTRRLEVVADGLPLFGRVHLTISTTIVHGESTKTVQRWRPRRVKERRYLALVGRQGICLVVLGVEVCGRWFLETRSFLSSYSDVETRRVGLTTIFVGVLCFLVQQHAPWRCFHLNYHEAKGVDSHCLPSHDMERDFRHAGLDT